MSETCSFHKGPGIEKNEDADEQKDLACACLGANMVQ